MAAETSVGSQACNERRNPILNTNKITQHGISTAAIIWATVTEFAKMGLTVVISPEITARRSLRVNTRHVASASGRIGTF
jgi:hypothetical protein